MNKTEDRSGQTPSRRGWIQYPADHGGDHYVDLHRDNSKGSQNAVERELPESAQKPRRR
jgi:hypothetical protein